MNVFEVCLTNFCNFRCTYCISDPNRGCDKFSQPLKLDNNGNLLIHSPSLSKDEINKREIILNTQGQSALDTYVEKEHNKWLETKDTKHDYGDWLDFDSLILFVKDNLPDNWLINLTGGEPLYYPKIEKLILELTKTHKVLVTTNISLIKNKPELLQIPRDKLFFRIGFHPEFRSIDHFISCMKYLIDNEFKYIINYVIHPSYYEESTKYKDHLKILKDNKFLFEVTPFEGNWNDKLYPTGILKRSELENKLFSINTKYEADSSLMGLNFLICEPNGDIYECQGKSKKLGQVYENKLSKELIGHSLCFLTKGCPTLKSTNMYLKIFLNTKVG